MNTPALTVTGLRKRFGALTVLDGIDLEVQRGERHVLFGPNGAGKTTLFNVISGLIPLDAGQITLLGTAITEMPVHDRARAGLVRTQQITSVFRRLSIEENIRLALQARSPQRIALLRRRDRLQGLRETVEEVLGRWGWQDQRHEPAAQLSYGQQRRLEIAVALAQEPRVLLLDEPMAGLTEQESRDILDIIAQLNREVTILLVEHNVKLALRLADRVTVMHHGAVVASATPDAITADEMVQRVYLGEPVQEGAE